MSAGGARLFLGVPLAAEARHAVAAHLRALPAPLPGRPVPPASWHLTLRFLGDTPPDDEARLRARLATAGLGPAFRLSFGRLAAYPRESRAAVLWLGVAAGEEPLRRLAAAVEAASVAAGFPPEPRPFSPHLTLARVRPPEDVRPLVHAAPPLDLTVPVDRVVLFRSHLGAGGARYEEVGEWALTG